MYPPPQLSKSFAKAHTVLSEVSASQVSLNSILGKKRECEVYAENNMAYFFVSNTSPSIYQNEKQIVIDPLNVKFKRDKKII